MFSKNDKVIFLDIDGVLNSLRSSAAFGRYPWNLCEESMQVFDHVAVELIRKLCSKHSIKIVLSSTWRKCFSASDMAKALKLPIVDSTPVKMGRVARGYEIDAYLQRHPDIENYVIIDDDSDMLPNQRNRFVQTCPFDGLRWKDFEDIKRILGIVDT